MGGATSFLRPVGPAADVKELEYITSLHQVIEPRNDGSIIDKDIEIFLKSRYGIVVTTEEVRETIFKGLQADVVTDGEEAGEAVLDMMELMSIILIPLLKKSRKLAEGHKLPEGVEAPPQGIIATVLERILRDALGSELDEDGTPPKLTVDLLRCIFHAYGEDGIAQNNDLLQEMVDCCQDQDEFGRGSIPLDKESFARGLTYDVDALDISNENRKTTSKDDVFLSYFVPKGRNAETVLGVDLDATHVKVKQAAANDVETVFTFSPIDLAASTYRSKSLMVFLYAAVLITYFAYWDTFSINQPNCEELGHSFTYSETPWSDNIDALACGIAASVVRWLGFFVVLCVFGVAAVVCASVGNDVKCDDWRWPALGMLTMMLLTAFPFMVKTSQALTNGGTSETERYLRYMSLVLGLIVCVLHLMHIISLRASESNFSWLRKALNPSALYSEYSMKKAVSHKLNKMAKNALDLLERDTENDVVMTSNFGRALFAFSKYGSTLEPAGGIMWTLREARSMELYHGEGIWYSARMLASNICQYILTMFLIAGGLYLSAYFDEQYTEENIEAHATSFIDYTLKSGIIDESVLQGVDQATLQKVAGEAVASLYPNEQYMITVPLIVGVLIAFTVSLNLAISFVPSLTSTILKLRCGVLPLKESPLLEQYRVAPESVAILIGSLFWGTLASSIVTGGIWGLVLFFFLWQATAFLAQRFLAVIIGGLVVFVIRYCILLFFRTKYFHGFYRTRPAAANLASLALEWSSFALSSGFIFVRMVKLLCIAGFSIGRIDKPLLAPGIGKIGPLDLDNLDGYPTVFMRDVLIHEAHRHPYLELLGTMYLYKLRYAESFGSTAGSCWRLLFVYGLMPWLHQYRIQTKSRLDEAVIMTGFDGTNLDSEGAGEARTLIANTRIVLGLNGRTDQTAVAPWLGGLGQTVFAPGQSRSRNLRSEEEEAYQDEIQKLKEENSRLRNVENGNSELERVKKQNAELMTILAALE